MEQIIALALFAVIAVGGSLLRKYLEKQQREQQAAQRDARQKAQRQQGQREYGQKPSGRPAETMTQQPAKPPAAQRQRQGHPAAATPRPQRRPMPSRPGPAARPRRPARAQPQPLQPARPAAPAEASRKEAAQQVILQQVRAEAARREVGSVNARLGRLDQAKFPALPTMSHAGLGAGTAATETGRRGGGVDYLGDMLRGRNVARAIVLSEILGPPKGLQ